MALFSYMVLVKVIIEDVEMDLELWFMWYVVRIIGEINP